MPNLPYRKLILYHLHIIDEKLDGHEELSEYPCWLKVHLYFPPVNCEWQHGHLEYLEIRDKLQVEQYFLKFLFCSCLNLDSTS